MCLNKYDCHSHSPFGFSETVLPPPSFLPAAVASLQILRQAPKQRPPFTIAFIHFFASNNGVKVSIAQVSSRLNQ